MKLLSELINEYGVSGKEGNVRSIVQREIKNCVNTVKIDNMGNLIAHKKGNKPALMFAAHMDEIGLMVKNIKNDGRISFSNIGGIDPLVLLGEKVKLKGKSLINGIITTEKINDSLEPEEIPTQEELFIDVGINSKEIKKLGIDIGSYIFLDNPLSTLGSKDIICGKALDDRIGTFIQLQLAKKLKNVKNEIYYVFTVQEELGLYGSKTAAAKLDIHMGIAIDVTNTNDFSGGNKKLGKGPTVTIKDAEMISNSCINDQLKKLAKKNKISLQLDVDDTGTTDALSISLSRGGIPSTAVGVPVKNLHTTVGIAHMKDVKNCIELLTLLAKDPPKTCVV